MIVVVTDRGTFTPMVDADGVEFERDAERLFDRFSMKQSYPKYRFDTFTILSSSVCSYVPNWLNCWC